jgi:ABC-2 type transport system permease protein
MTSRRLVASEFRKLLSTRLWLWLMLAAMALTGLYASLLIGFSDDPDTLTAPLTTPKGQQTLFAVAAGGANTLAAVLAGIGITGEFRHRTATATFLTTPIRREVVVAKLITYVAVGVGFAVACLVVVALIAVPWLAAKDIDVALLRNGLPGTYAGVVADTAIFSFVGVGLGALVRNQVATVVGLLVYRFVAEPIVTSVPALSDWSIYLPGSASAALTQVSLSTQDYLDAWQGGLVLAGYALALAVLGTMTLGRRDVS